MYWADKSAAAHYRVNDLSPEDARRQPARARPKARADWEVSRVALHAARLGPPTAGEMSLSHSHGHALCGKAPAGWAVGVDLERTRPRDFISLAGWVCSDHETRALAAMAGQAQSDFFYQLWTLKEAFIKAAGLDFPADMSKVGLVRDAQGAWRLRAPPGAWRAASWKVGADWMASMVWSAPDRDATYPRWQAVAGCALPALTQVGTW